jgi:hypothetical protein
MFIIKIIFVFIWNSNLTGQPVFLFAKLATLITRYLLLTVMSPESWEMLRRGRKLVYQSWIVNYFLIYKIQMAGAFSPKWKIIYTCSNLILIWNCSFCVLSDSLLWCQNTSVSTLALANLGCSLWDVSACGCLGHSWRLIHRVPLISKPTVLMCGIYHTQFPKVLLGLTGL